MQFGTELTFVPNKIGKWKEFLSEKEAKTVNALFSQRVKKLNRLSAYYGATYKSKADFFRAFSQEHRAWCIEVNNILPISYICFYKDEIVNHFDSLVREAKKINLYPRIVKETKNAIKYWPTGGGHIHVSMAVIGGSNRFLYDLYWLEKNLAIDFVNRPYIRWLFAEWSDNQNSRVAIYEAKNFTYLNTIISKKEKENFAH